jgi:amino acid transporter
VAGLVLTFVIGLILFLPFPSWQQLVGFITSATVLSFGAGPLVVASLRREEPDRHRPFRLPGGDVLPFAGFYAANMIIYWGGWDVDRKLFLTVLIGWVLLAAYPVISRSHGSVRERLELRAGLWVVPWFGGLTLVSWLADPDKHPHAFNWVFLINLGLSAVIYALALRSRQPRAAIERHLAEAADEAGEFVSVG